MEYFPQDPALQFVLVVEAFPNGSRDLIQMATSSGDTAPHTRRGQLKFEVDGESVALTVYRSVDGEDFFLPFMDETNGNESYSDGRYLDLLYSGDRRVVLDFNFAYNSYCAYNPYWICPIPPSENRLPVAITAVEKAFPGAEGH